MREFNNFAVGSNNPYSMNENQLQKLLTEVNNVCIVAEQERKAKESRGECYNVFNVLNIKTKEVKLHSPFIAELLNPCGSHGLRGLFLKAFLKQVKLSENYIDVELCKQDIMERRIGKINEDKTEGGRIDIIIEDGSHSLIIENKIYAEEQPNQLLRYFNYAQGKFKNFKIIYLTLYGEEANKLPPNVKVDYDCMSYREGIIGWLSECAKLAFAHPLVRETINQYIQLIKQLTNTTMDENHMNKVAEIAVKNMDSMLAIFNAKSEIAEILREKYIFEPLRKYAQKKSEHGESLEINISDTINFSRNNWSGNICVLADNANFWTSMYIRIISNNEEGKTTSLRCLKVPANEDYPYGQEYVGINDWESPESFRAIKDGEVANWIINKVDEILKEIDEKGITL